MPGSLSSGKPIRKLTTDIVVSPELVAALVPLLLPPLVPLLVAPLLPVIAPVLPALAPVLVPSVVPALVAPLVPILAPAIIPAVVPALVPLLAPVLVPALVTPVLSAIIPLVVSSFNTRTGAVALLSSDVTGALTFTPSGLSVNTFTGLQTLSGGLTVSFGAISLGDIVGTLGFFGSAPIVKQASGENLTNNVTPAGIDGVIPNLTLSNYNTDGPLISEALYQLARKLKQANDALRAYGLLT